MKWWQPKVQFNDAVRIFTIGIVYFDMFAIFLHHHLIHCFCRHCVNYQIIYFIIMWGDIKPPSTISVDKKNVSSQTVFYFWSEYFLVQMYFHKSKVQIAPSQKLTALDPGHANFSNVQIHFHCSNCPMKLHCKLLHLSVVFLTKFHDWFKMDQSDSYFDQCML